MSELQADLIRATTIADGVYDRLRLAIVSGELKPASRLIEAQLARTLNVSRTPLREAFHRLERERLVEREPRGGMRVSPVSLAELQHLTEIRLVIEGKAVRDAANRMSAGEMNAADDDVFAQMHWLIEEMRRYASSSKMQDYLRVGRAFHSCIYELSGNPWCTHIMTQILDALERYRWTVPPERFDDAIGEHAAILAAIRSGDGDKSEDLITRHLSKGSSHHRQRLS